MAQRVRLVHEATSITRNTALFFILSSTSGPAPLSVVCVEHITPCVDVASSSGSISCNSPQPEYTTGSHCSVLRVMAVGDRRRDCINR